MHPRCGENAVREKPGMAGACDVSAGASYARDKPAGAFVVSCKMLVGLVEYQESGRTLGERTDVRRDGQTGKINTPSLETWRTWLMKIEKVTGPHHAVMSGRVMFSEVVSQIVSAAAPVDKELVFGDAVFDPVEAHVNGFGTTLFDSVVGDAGSAGIVSLDGSGWLGMAHLGEGGAEPGTIFGIIEEGAKFSFGGGGHNSLDDGAVDVNGAVERWRSRVGIGWGSRIFGEGAEEEDATGTGTGFGLREVRGVTVDMENHPAGGVADRGIWMGGTVVEELSDGLSSGFSTFRLGRRKGSKGNKHCGVNGARIVEDGANDFLESSEARGI